MFFWLYFRDFHPCGSCRRAETVHVHDEISDVGIKASGTFIAREGEGKDDLSAIEETQLMDQWFSTTGRVYS